jgi:hypothetical protein
MNNSNFSLRFSRSAREAYGHNIQFVDGNRKDKIVGIVCAILAAFVVGMMIGGVV